VLVNNAGILHRGDLAEFDFSGMEPMRRVNVDGLVHVTRAVVPGMQAAGFGRIINLTSIAAFGTAMPGTTFYAATKAAGDRAHQALRPGSGCARHHRKRRGAGLHPHRHGIGGTAPRSRRRSCSRAWRARRWCAGLARRRISRTPLRFWPASRAGFITGQVLVVDGGRTDYLAP
jgi:3-oxoacyl-[acyl-carrier protein] reductase